LSPIYDIDYFPPILADKDIKKKHFLQKYIKFPIEWYGMIREHIDDHNFYVCENIILTFSGQVYSWKYTQLEYQRVAHFYGVVCSRFLMDTIYDEYMAEQCEDEISYISDDDKELSNHVQVYNETYAPNKNTFTIKDISSVVEKLNQKLSTNLGQLRVEPMAIVHYAIATLAQSHAFKCLGVEYKFYGMTPDVVLQTGKMHIIIETKNTKQNTGKKQLLKYLDCAKQNNIQAIGVLFLQYKITFYSQDVIPIGISTRLKNLFHGVRKNLAVNHEVYGTDHFAELDRCGAIGFD